MWRINFLYEVGAGEKKNDCGSLTLRFSVAKTKITRAGTGAATLTRQFLWTMKRTRVSSLRLNTINSQLQPTFAITVTAPFSS